MQDTDVLEKLAHFAREKIPARNVHALGCGAYGTFTVTNDITKYTNAKLFSKVGKKTDIVIRMSGIFTEQGDPGKLNIKHSLNNRYHT
jgi:catalase